MSPFYITVRIYSSSFIFSFLALGKNSLLCFDCSNLENKSPVMPSKFRSLLGKQKKKHSLLGHVHPAPQKAAQSSPWEHSGPLDYICPGGSTNRDSTGRDGHGKWPGTSYRERNSPGGLRTWVLRQPAFTSLAVFTVKLYGS